MIRHRSAASEPPTYDTESLRSLLGSALAVNEAIELQSRTETSQSLDPPNNFTTHENETAPHIAKWLTKPEKLPGLAGRLFYVATDIGLSILCLLFLSFCGTAYIVNGKVLDEHGKFLIKVARYGTTIFPYLFAAAMNRVLKAIAKWQLERGIGLGTLVNLLTTNTITSVLVNPIKMRNLHWLSITLFLLWSLSPIGSQASLRVVSTRLRTINSTEPISWLDTHTVSAARANPARSSQLYSASLLSSPGLHNSSLDMWGNVKLPVLETIPNSTPEDDWLVLPSSTNYSSLLGIPISARAMEGNSSFMIENVTYWYSDCYAFSSLTLRDADLETTTQVMTNLTDYSSWYINAAGSGRSWQIAFKPDLSNAAYYGIPEQTFPPQSDYAELVPPGGPMDFAFEVLEWADDNFSLMYRSHYDCQLSTSSIDVLVNCFISSGCSVHSARYTPHAHRPNTFWGTINEFSQFKDMVSDFASAVWQPSGSSSVEPTSTLFDFYLQDPTTVSDQNSGLTTIRELTPQTVGLRLGQALNTYWLAYLSPFTVPLGSLSSNDTPIEMDGYADGVPADSWTRNGSMTAHKIEEYLYCDKGWLSALCLATSLLLGSLICSTCLRLTTTGPDTLDIISALTRENGIEIPKGGSYMDGDTRARLLRNMRVRLGDQKLNEEVGSIVIGHDNVNEIGRLQKGRLYE